MRSKIGLLLDDEMLSFIVGALVLGGLIYLLVHLFTPSYDPLKETSKSYFDSLIEQIKFSEGGVGKLSLLNLGGDVNYYVVYFGEKATVSGGLKGFFSSGNNKNRICICYENSEGVGKCNSCSNLKSSATYNGAEDSWYFSSRDVVEIKKEGDKYVFKKIA